MAQHDLDIARRATPRAIAELAREQLGVDTSALRPHGHHVAKLTLAGLGSLAGRPDGRLILVSAISPTPAGEGKTTTTIGLADGLRRLGQRAVLALREPSHGAGVRLKGGATGGGRRRWCRWRTSTCTSPATSTPSRWRTTCWRR
jgi:formate--tetrahydrofolate ligase